MIKRLQRRFVAITMGSLALVMAVIIGLINFINFYQTDKKADSLLGILSENGGAFPEPAKDKGRRQEGRPHAPEMTEETRFETRYFLVWTDADGAVSQIDTSHIAAVSSSQAREYAEKLLAGARTSGYTGAYKYGITDQDGGKLVVFIDRSSQQQTCWNFLLVSCAIAAAGFLVVLILVSALSRRAIRPVTESVEKQKQFITDAGHEIKTPLAIISANTEVLELTAGKNEWTESIRNQTKRLDALVKDLITLSKLEEGRIQLDFADFSLSETVEETALSFAMLAQSRGKHLKLDVQPGVILHGNEGSIRQLISILVDNAVKYADEQGTIRVALSLGKPIKLSVSNSCENLPGGDLSKLFDRFYRADSSRSRAGGGYGIGLSIARAVVQAHHGSIRASREGRQSICFTVTL